MFRVFTYSVSALFQMSNLYKSPREITTTKTLQKTDGYKPSDLLLQSANLFRSSQTTDADDCGDCGGIGGVCLVRSRRLNNTNWQLVTEQSEAHLRKKKVVLLDWVAIIKRNINKYMNMATFRYLIK